MSAPQDDESTDTTDLATVLAWHEALNGVPADPAALDTLIDLSSDDIELSGPEGASQGLVALRAWAESSGLRLEPGRTLVREGVVVVAAQASWPGQPGTREVATAFRVVDNQVVSVFRHADLAEALGATGLTEDDGV